MPEKHKWTSFFQIDCIEAGCWWVGTFQTTVQYNNAVALLPQLAGPDGKTSSIFNHNTTDIDYIQQSIIMFWL